VASSAQAARAGWVKKPLFEKSGAKTFVMLEPGYLRANGSG
jgi:hypothetical protein